jgi:hypothetical protein
MTTRPSAVARLFYEDDPDWLRTQASELRSLRRATLGMVAFSMLIVGRKHLARG